MGTVPDDGSPWNYGGPWDLAYVRGGGWTIRDRAGRAVAFQSHDGIECQLRLATAAPELLEACKGLLVVLCGTIEKATLGTIDPETLTTVKRARVAIARGEGRKS